MRVEIVTILSLPLLEEMKCELTKSSCTYISLMKSLHSLTISTFIAFFLLSLEFGSFKLINISAVVDMTS